MDHLVSPPLADPFGARATLSTSLGTTVSYYRLAALADQGFSDLGTLPFTVRILLENALRHAGGEFVGSGVVEALAGWKPRPAGEAASDIEIPFLPARVVLQDFTGVPAWSTSPRCARPSRGWAATSRRINPARAGRSGDRSLGPGRSLRHPARLRPQRRAGVRAQPRAVRAAALGAAVVPELPRRAARHRHRPPGQPRVPGAGRRDPADSARKRSPSPIRWSAPTPTRR